MRVVRVKQLKPWHEILLGLILEPKLKLSAIPMILVTNYLG